MFPPFPTDEAQRVCYQLIDSLDSCMRLDVDVSADFANPAFSLDVIKKDSPGFMVGVCICRDCSGNRVVLKAFSGQYNGLWLCPGWSPPLLDVDAYCLSVSENDAAIHELSDVIASMSDGSANDSACFKKQMLIARRAQLSRQSMERIFALYMVHCFDGSVRSFFDIFGARMVPTGTGDCCAPKLLNEAALRGLQPVSLAECFYSHDSRHGVFFNPCDDKCALLLPVILGLEIVYRDDSIIVVNKPSGLLSVPGRGDDKQDCVVTRVQRLFSGCIPQPSVHRLDMDTSGLLVLAFTADAHRNLSGQFMNGTVFKQYTAILDGIPECVLRGARRGIIVSFFRLDVDNRPHQIYDCVYGKKGVTEWKLCSIERGRSRIEFTPQTGRTHQLRLHSAHRTGLGTAIAGDNLYGTPLSANRLLLHCHLLSFVHPVTYDRMTFSASVPF